MKVAFLHFFTFRLLRGIETLIISLANELANKGIDVSIVSAKSTLDRTLIPVSSKVRIKQMPTFRYYESRTIVPFYIYDLIKSKYDIVNIFFADFGEAAAIRAALKVVKFHLNLYICYPVDSVPHRFENFRKYHLDQRADLIICDSGYVAEGAEKYFQQGCVVVPVGTDAERFKSDPEIRKGMRNKLGIAEDEVVLLNVSELEQRKGTWRVIEALPYVREKFPKIRYLILGKGEYQLALEKRVVELNLRDCVKFLGTTTDLLSFYNAADIFIMLPDHEANSIASHEAMACELPLIVANTGGFEEVAEPNCARLVNIHDRGEIVRSILELAENSELRHELGERGRKVIQERLTWDVISNRLIEIFRKEVEV
jgi:glycosyltransferase involved in cell wall biosynthesis